jgi:hypothetical protein
MKKRLWLAALPALTLLIAYCGGGGGVTSPETASALFENPDGTVTDENATEVQNSALDAANNGDAFVINGLDKLAPRARTSVMNAVKSRLSSIRTQDSCEAQSSSGEIDASELDNDYCSYTGSIKYTFKLNSDCSSQGEITFDGFTIDCPDYGASGSCDGKMSYNDELFCANITCSSEGESETYNGCVLYADNSVLVDAEGGSAVCVSVTPNDDCSEVSAEWRDADGDLTLTCEVATRDDSDCPPNATGVLEVDNCEITRN